MSNKTEICFDTVTIGAQDVRALAAFYRNIFGFTKAAVNAGQDAPAGSLCLRAPDYGAGGPHFLLIPAKKEDGAEPVQANDTGYTHLCFEADDVRGIIEQVLKNGGTMVSRYDYYAKLVAAYMRDPAGNLLEVHLPTPQAVTPATVWRLLRDVIALKLGLPAPKKSKTRFLHVNIITKDWEKCTAFYRSAFDGHRVGKPRDYEGSFIRNLAGMSEPVHVVGEHVSMPGYGVNCPTVEVFTYSVPSGQKPRTLSDTGILCLGFSADDMDAAVKAVTDAGGAVVSRNQQAALLTDVDGNLLRIVQRNA